MSDRGTGEDQVPRAKKRKPVTVPERPHRPLNAYNLFFADERKRMIQEAGGKDTQKAKMGFADMARSVSKRWKQVSEEDKAHYLRLAAIDKQRYYREMNEWYRLNNEDSPEGEDNSSSPEKSSENEDDRKPSPLVHPAHDSKLEKEYQQDDSKPAPQEQLPSHPSTGFGVAASMQDLGLAQQRIQNDVYASALSQQANLLSLPSDPSNVNSSTSQNPGFASSAAAMTGGGGGLLPQQAQLQQYLEQQINRNTQARSTSSQTYPGVATSVAPQHMTGGSIGSHADLAYLQLLQKLQQMQQQQQSHPSVEHQGYAAAAFQAQQNVRVPPPAYAVGSPDGLLNTSIKPIHVGPPPHGTTDAHEQGFTSLQENKESPPQQETNTDRIAAAASYLSSVAARSSPQGGDQEASSNDPRGSIRQHLNAMITLGTMQQQQQQQEGSSPPQELQHSRPRQYQYLASNLGDDALGFFVDTFLDDEDQEGQAEHQRTQQTQNQQQQEQDHLPQPGPSTRNQNNR